MMQRLMVPNHLSSQGLVNVKMSSHRKICLLRLALLCKSVRLLTSIVCTVLPLMVILAAAKLWPSFVSLAHTFHSIFQALTCLRLFNLLCGNDDLIGDLDWRHILNV